MRIFVLGAGRMGSAVIQDLVGTRKDVELGVGDMHLARAQELVKGAGQAFKVEVTDLESLSSILKNYEAVVNATWYENNLHVMRACLKAGCNYNDLGGLFHMTRKQLTLDSEAKARGISAVVGGGESPGITNVMCALAAEGLSSVESVKIYAGAKETSSNAGLVFPFSASTVIDEYTRKPVEFLNGEYVEVPPLSGDEEVQFAEPVGKKVCHYSIHSEPATLPTSIGRGVKNVEFRLGILEKMVRTLSPLIEIGMMTEERNVLINGQLVSPKEFLVAFFNANSSSGESLERWVSLKVVVSGVYTGKKCMVSCDLIAAPSSYGFKNATAYLTGVAGSVFGQYLAEGKVGKGVVAPELAIDPQVFSKELEKRGIEIVKRLAYFE